VLPISQISAPVFDSRGAVAMVLGVQGFPHQMKAAEFAEVAGLIVSAADGVTARVGGRPPPTH
jgi:DNA-binding IclR family transcriptional regulator